MTKSQVKRLKTKVDHTHGISQRKLARIFNVSPSYICKTLKKKTNIRYRKKIKVPKRTDQQKAVLRSKCTKLSAIFRGKEVVIDDESYFRLSNSDLSGNAGFYTSDTKQTPDSVKLKRVAKYEQKLLVWVAISPSGMSKHYIVPSGQAVDQTVYIEKCLKARLIPYINSLQNKGDVIFWPDLASSHYSKNTLSFLKA
jgi:transcriptional regulator with XRE-family HTH domain